MFLSLLHVNVGGDPDHPAPGRKWLGDIYRVHQRLWMGFCEAHRRTEDKFFLDTWTIPEVPDSKPKRQESGFLFRVERDGNPRILIQSVERPDWDYAFQNAPYLLATDPDRQPKIIEFDPSPRADEMYRFRLFANVVNRKSDIHPNGKMRTTHSGLTIHRKRRTEVPVRPGPTPYPLPSDPIERERLLIARWEPWRTWLENIGARHGFRIADKRPSPLFMESVYALVRNPGKSQGGSNQDKPTEKRFNAGLFEGLLVCTDPDRLRDAVITGIGSAKAFGFGLLSVKRP